MKKFYEAQEHIRERLFDAGWTYDEKDVDFTVYRKTMPCEECKSQYDIKMTVWVVDDEDELERHHELGVCDFFVEGFSDNCCALPPYNLTDLEDFMKAIHFAEEQLLAAGVPFMTDYYFNVNSEERAERNKQIREEMDLKQIEKETLALL